MFYLIQFDSPSNKWTTEEITEDTYDMINKLLPFNECTIYVSCA